MKFPHLNVFIWQLKLVTTVPSAEDLSGLLNPSPDRFSPVRNAKRYYRKACFNALPVVAQVHEVSSTRSSREFLPVFLVSSTGASLPYYHPKNISLYTVLYPFLCSFVQSLVCNFSSVHIFSALLSQSTPVNIVSLE
jgi:hypothetical protein